MQEGAAKGALSLHRGLLEQGVDSSLACFGASNVQVSSIQDMDSALARVGRRANSLFDRLAIRRRVVAESDGFHAGAEWLNLFGSIRWDAYDIVHLHWVNGALGLRHIEHLKRATKVVWTIRDMWPFTGGCHYSLGCRGFESGCGSCPQLASADSRDASMRAFRRKVSALAGVSFVAISDWLKDEALKSEIVSVDAIRRIYNSVDLSTFAPSGEPVAELRKRFGIPAGKRICLLGAQNVSHRYKGPEIARRLIMKNRDCWHFVVFGRGADSLFGGLEGASYTDFGFVDGQALRSLYELADVFAMPSVQEAFGKTVVEALACGTPVCVQPGSAPEEIVRRVMDQVHYCDRDDLRACADESPDRARVEQLFGEARIAREYLDLYSTALE